jgi:hypothetical protein
VVIVKILHLLGHLTKNYSIGMSFFKVHARVPGSLEGEMPEMQTRLSGF